MKSKLPFLVVTVAIIRCIILLFWRQKMSDSVSPFPNFNETFLVVIDRLHNITTVDSESERLRAMRDSQCLDLIKDRGHCVCDYVNLKGIRKSGTSWMFNTLKRIRDHFCNESGINNLYTLSFCKKSSRHTNVFSYSRHDLVLPGQMEDRRTMNHFKNNRTLFQQELDQTRFCTVNVFRDPRDRWVSEAFWNSGYKTTKKRFNDSSAFGSEAFDRINNKIRSWYNKDKLTRDIAFLNEYWRTFRDEERRNPLRFYNYFYEDMVLDKVGGIKHLLEFIGLYHVDGLEVNDDDIAMIIDQSSHETARKEGNNINFRRGNVCGFREELTKENVEILQYSTMAGLDSELMGKFNKTCLM